eukprot:s1963_g5.t1
MGFELQLSTLSLNQMLNKRSSVMGFELQLSTLSLNQMLNKRMHEQDMADFFGDYQDMETMAANMEPSGPPRSQLPLRMVLTVALFKELTDRLNQTLASRERLKKVTDQGWRNEAGWRFQRWNPTLKHLEADTAKAPIPDDKLLDQLATILQCLKHPIVNRFRCKRKLTETMTTQATFVLDVSMRGPSSTTLWEALRILQNNAVLQLIGTSYKTEGLGRSNMEQHIRNLMYG